MLKVKLSTFTEDEEVDSYDSDDGQYIRAPPSSEAPSTLAVTGATPSSVVKLEANQKARKKRERQELYGKRLCPYIIYIYISLYFTGLSNTLSSRSELVG